MGSFGRFQFPLTCLTLVLFLFFSLACSYKPPYLKKSESTSISERWMVRELDPSKFSGEEKEVYEKMGPPVYIRFFRRLSVEREKVYMWIYTEPVQLFSFLDGRKVDYLVLDNNPSSLNQADKDILLWTGIVVGSLAVIGGAVYYFTSEED